MKRVRLFSLGTAIVAAACGGTQPAETPASSEPAAVAEPEQKWEQMNRAQRMEYMGLTVMPAMKKLFKEYDGESGAEFKCQTCHGEDMKEVDYKMPNGLYGLPKADPITASKEEDPEMTEFMMNKVVPEMATLLDMKPGPEGLGCFSCHESE